MTGRFAISEAGHDTDQLYVIVAFDEKYVYLCDGKYKRIASPKKKNRKHVNITEKSVKEELLKRLTEHSTVYDEEIKYAIRQYYNEDSK